MVHTVDRDDDLVDVLLVGSAGSIASDASGELRAEAVHPQPDRLPADDDAPLGQQVFDVGRAQREAMAGPDRAGDHLAGKAASPSGEAGSDACSCHPATAGFSADQFGSALGGDIAGDGVGRLVFTILAAVAEAERDRIRERTRTTKQDQKKRGRYLGGPVPFGFSIDADGFLEERADCAALVDEIRRRAAAG